MNESKRITMTKALDLRKLMASYSENIKQDGKLIGVVVTDEECHGISKKLIALVVPGKPKELFKDEMRELLDEELALLMN